MNEAAYLLIAEEGGLTSSSLVNRGDEHRLQRETTSNIWQKKEKSTTLKLY